MNANWSIVHPSHSIETPYVGYIYNIDNPLLLQSQPSEPLLQILDLFHITSLVEFLACLL